MRAIALAAFTAAALAAVSCDMYLDNIGEEGEPCATNGSCYYGLMCIWGSCSEIPVLGEECDPSRNSEEEACDGDLYCIEYSDGYECGVLPGEGETCLCKDYNSSAFYPCDDSDDADQQISSGEAYCGDGLGCSDGLCVLPIPGTVEQPGSTNVWLRCPIGMTWDGWRCQGDYDEFAWAAAMGSCPSGFEVPTAYDFVEIFDNCSALTVGTADACESCTSSSVCNAMFPDDKLTDSFWSDYAIKTASYWTSTLTDGATYEAYYVKFDSDPWTFSNVDKEEFSFLVLCVQY